MHIPVSSELYRALKRKGKYEKSKRRNKRERAYAFKKYQKYLKEKGEVINA